MDTQIRYLELVHGDLAAAGRRETVRGRRRPLRDRSRWTVPVAAGLATLLVAGAIGWWVRSGGLHAGENQSSSVSRAEIGRQPGLQGNDVKDFDRLAPAPSAVPSASPAPAGLGQGGGGAGVATPSDGLSKIIRTARIDVVIPRDSFEDRFSQASDIASANGGFVASSTTQRRSGTLTIRIPATNFTGALHALRELGTVQTQTIQGRDVTADYVDLQARVRIARARREVLLKLMDKATTIEQTIRVQNALDDTQLRIEQLQGQLNVLNDRTSLATIQLDLREQGVQPREHTEPASIPNAFERAWAGFVGVIAGIVIGLGYLLPVILIGLVVLAVVILARRRRTA